MQDLGRLAADLLLFYTQEFAFVTLPEAFTTGSSIMPQKRNPDVFELVRGRTRRGAGLPRRGARASSPSCPPATSATCSCIKLAAVPRHRPRARDRSPSWRSAIDGVRFRADAIRLDPSIHAAEEANALVVREGIPFREAYRRVAARLKR